MQVFHKDFLSPTGFVRNVATMLVGNVTAQAVTLLAALVVTRLYTPIDFGVMTYITAIIGICSVFSCMQYENAIVLPKEEGKALNVFVLCILCVSMISLLLVLIAYLWRESLPDLVVKPWLGPWLWFIPVGVFVQGLFVSLSNISIRKKEFTSLSFANVISSISTALIKIVPGIFLGTSIFWLISGNIGGLLVSVVLLFGSFLHRDLAKIRRFVKRSDIFAAAKEYSNFPQYAILTGLLNSLSQNLPILLFANYFSQDIVGYYGLANSILRKPISLMGDSLSKVYRQKAAELQYEGRKLRNSMVKTTLGLFGIGIIPFGLLTVFGSSIFSIVFGENWATAGLYAQILAPWLFLLFINPPATQVIIVKQKLQFNFLFNTTAVILRAASIVIGYHLSPQVWIAVSIFSGCGVMLNIFYIWYAFLMTK
jgi:O-antigen/teichoic acid export membrane protein